MNTSSPSARVLTTAIGGAHTLPTTTLITSDRPVIPPDPTLSASSPRTEGHWHGGGSGSRTGAPRAVVGGPDRRLGTDARRPEPPDLPRRRGRLAVRAAGARPRGLPGGPRHPTGSG